MEGSKAKLLEEMSDLKSENTRLKIEKNRFQIIFENSILGNKIIDSSLRIIQVNKALLSSLGYKEDEIIGAQITDFAHPDHSGSWKILQNELWGRKKTSFSIETCILKKDGTSVPVRVTSILFPHDNENLGYTILEDISERIEMDRLKVVAQNLKFEIEKKEIDKLNQKKSVALILEAQENERKRIAESLHNSIGQTLFGVKLSLDRVNPDTSTMEENLKFVQHSKQLLDDAIKETRRISHELMPGILIDYGLQEALEEICSQYMGTLSISCSIKCETEHLDKYLATTIFRTAQELVLNIVKHASAATARITLSQQKKTIKLKVEDNGRGFDPNVSGDGIGLRTIRSKVHLLHGEMSVDSKKDHGTKIVITFPLTTKSRKSSTPGI